MLHDNFGRKVVCSSNNGIAPLPDHGHIGILVLLDRLVAVLALLLHHYLLVELEAVVAAFVRALVTAVRLRRLRIVLIQVARLKLLVEVLVLLDALVDLLGVAKVDQLDVVVRVQHHVHRFHIAVHHLFVLEHRDGVDQLRHEDFCEVLADAAELCLFGRAAEFVDQGFEVAVGQVLEDEDDGLVGLQWGKQWLVMVK